MAGRRKRPRRTSMTTSATITDLATVISGADIAGPFFPYQCQTNARPAGYLRPVIEACLGLPSAGANRHPMPPNPRVGPLSRPTSRHVQADGIKSEGQRPEVGFLRARVDFAGSSLDENETAQPASYESPLSASAPLNHAL